MDDIDDFHRNKSDKEKSEKETVKKTLVQNDHLHPDLLLKDQDDWKKRFVGKHIKDCSKGL